ncbi:MAG: hypothetical protein ACTSQP_16870 [Promethearchaeota archaeon]
MDYALMFEVQEGGVSVPIPWSKDAFQPDKSIIVLDEASLTLFLWHGIRQGLVARRTALRQAESLKGHGYTIGKSIIGRDIKQIIEIDARKVGRVPEETEKNEKLQELLNKPFKELDNYVITFSVAEAEAAEKAEEAKKPVVSTAKPIEQPKVEPEPIQKPVESKPTPSIASSTSPPVSASKPIEKEPIKIASEYEMDDDILPAIKEEKPKPTPVQTTTVPQTKEAALADIRIGIVLRAILDNYDDIWVSKKEDGSYSVEMMDGPICTFRIEDQKIKFTQNSFSGIDPAIKSKIQKKYVELSKLL